MITETLNTPTLATVRRRSSPGAVRPRFGGRGHLSARQRQGRGALGRSPGGAGARRQPEHDVLADGTAAIAASTRSREAARSELCYLPAESFTGFNTKS